LKSAIITGITGQDGFFLSKLLLDKGYEVHGIARRNSTMHLGNLEKMNQLDKKKIIIHWGDITDNIFLDNVLKKVQPDELYHLAAQSFVFLSFSNPKSTYDINIGGTLNIANAVKDYSPNTRVYFAATSELFGETEVSPQNEKTPFYPKSPYGVSKLAGFWTMKNYRESYKLFMCNGILFNHESEVRGEEFVTRKIAKAAVNISVGKQDFLELGNIDARRDWGYAKEYVNAMWLMLQKDQADDYIIATNEIHSIREFVEEAFNVVGIKINWAGKGIEEKGIDSKSGKIIVKINPELFRPVDVESIVGDYSKAKKTLGWEPKIKFKELVNLMVESELNNIKK